jgi:uncharacterized membrane-anchored protein
LLVLLQLWTPAAMIRNRENVLSSGKVFKFRSAPVDPGDPFRGKFITLNFRDNSYIQSRGVKWLAGEDVFVQLDKDSAGYAHIHSLHKKAPANGTDYIKATISYTSNETDGKVYIDWPFLRFYMEEGKAAGAEKAYNRSLADSSKITYASVKVKNGDAVLENVFINEQPIVYYLKK